VAKEKIKEKEEMLKQDLAWRPRKRVQH